MPTVGMDCRQISKSPGCLQQILLANDFQAICGSLPEYISFGGVITEEFQRLHIQII